MQRIHVKRDRWEVKVNQKMDNNKPIDHNFSYLLLLNTPRFERVMGRGGMIIRLRIWLWRFILMFEF